MSRTPGSNKAETHERIVNTAARAIREHGYTGASVADVMKQAGLTHGGFYAHFESRDAMVEEALDRAAGEGRARLTAAGERAEPGRGLEAIVGSYLSDRHVEHPETGCSLAALGSETRRQSPALRRIATRQVRGLADLLAAQMPGGDAPENRDRALATLSTMVGALLLSRAVDDPALSQAMRNAVLRSVAGDAGRGDARSSVERGAGRRAAAGTSARRGRRRRSS